MLQPTRVLPSNAPPLQEGGDGLHQASRVLQEHSGNRQQHYDFGNTSAWDQSKYSYDDQKYPANVLAGENAYPRHHVQHHQGQHQHTQLYQPQPQHRATWRYSYPRGYQDEAALQYNAERLYRRFRQSDQYNKYRTRQSKEDKGNGEQKWPDHLEKAFFRALITYPPMGRRKQLHKEKQRGRNELIADCIEELTGEARTRKQVSSHIQVLKPFVENDPLIMKWLSKDDLQGQLGRYHGQPYATGRRMSNYPVAAPPHGMRSAMPSLPRTDAYGIQQLKQSPSAFEPADFQMFIQRKCTSNGKEDIDRLHVYSQAVPHPLGEERTISDWGKLARDFPQLAVANAQRPLDCTVVIAEASLAFPTESMEKWKTRDGASIELGIYFQCRSSRLPAPRPGMKSTISLVNKFFDRGEDGLQREAIEHSETTEVYFHNVPNMSNTVETEIKFGSKFWAKTLGHVGNKMRDPGSLTMEQRAQIKEEVRSLAAVQEVYIATDRGPERIMVIHWNFRLSSGECGRASWKRLILPDSSSTTGIYTAFPQPGAPSLKSERADSFYDYASSLGDLTGGSQQQTHPPPTLQSPFEYDTSHSSANSHSNPNSALSSATWPSTLSDGSAIAADFAADNTFDFNAGSINLAYDSSGASGMNSLNFDTGFDSSAFTFDDLGAVADPALADFSQGTVGWYDDAAAFDTVGHGTDAHHHHHGLGHLDNIEVDVNVGESFATQPDLDAAGGSQMYGSYDPQFDGHVYGAAGGDEQAYGGAGPEMQGAIKEEDALGLSALADASAEAEIWGRGGG